MFGGFVCVMCMVEEGQFEVVEVQDIGQGDTKNIVLENGDEFEGTFSVGDVIEVSSFVNDDGSRTYTRTKKIT